MKEHIQTAEKFIKGKDIKLVKKLQVPLLVRLLNKLDGKELDNDVLEAIDFLTMSLKEFTDEKRIMYIKRFALLRNISRKRYNLHPKGEIPGGFMALGTGVGVAVGASLMSINPGMIGAGIAIGVALGITLGTRKENKENEKGNIY